MKRQDARKLDHNTLEAIRVRAVRQVQSGESPEVIIGALGFSRACIYNWLAAYRAAGWEALKARKLYGRPHKLKGSQIQWIYRTVTLKNPLQLKFPFALWTRAMIRTLIWRKYRVKLSLASVGRLLAQLGLSCQKPLAKAFEQNRSLVQQWVKKEYPKIRAWAKREGAEILFADESGVRSDFHAGTTWAPIGQTPVVRQTGQRFSLNMISAVSPKGQLRFMVTPKGIRAGVFVEFLKRLMHGWKRPIFLIVDGHPTHKARVVTACLEKMKGKLRLFYLPPYSPELNPDEYVWNDVKNNAVGRSMITNVKNLRSTVESRLRYLQKNPAHVRTFFQSETTRYAA
ncbi:MAG: IS630 family transposase [Candidatus Acidiferrales bacterium]